MLKKNDDIVVTVQLLPRETEFRAQSLHLSSTGNTARSDDVCVTYVNHWCNIEELMM